MDRLMDRQTDGHTDIPRKTVITITIVRWGIKNERQHMKGTCKTQAWKLTLCMLGNFACFFIICGFFFKLTFLKKICKKYHQCQTVWIQIRPNIWVQTVCNSYQQTTKVATSGKRVNMHTNNTNQSKLVSILITFLITTAIIFFS